MLPFQDLESILGIEIQSTKERECLEHLKSQQVDCFTQAQNKTPGLFKAVLANKKNFRQGLNFPIADTDAPVLCAWMYHAFACFFLKVCNYCDLETTKEKIDQAIDELKKVFTRKGQCASVKPPGKLDFSCESLKDNPKETTKVPEMNWSKFIIIILIAIGSLLFIITLVCCIVIKKYYFELKSNSSERKSSTSKESTHIGGHLSVSNSTTKEPDSPSDLRNAAKFAAPISATQPVLLVSSLSASTLNDQGKHEIAAFSSGTSLGSLTSTERTLKECKGGGCDWMGERKTPTSVSNSTSKAGCLDALEQTSPLPSSPGVSLGSQSSSRGVGVLWGSEQSDDLPFVGPSMTHLAKYGLSMNTQLRNAHKRDHPLVTS